MRIKKYLLKIISLALIFTLAMPMFFVAFSAFNVPAAFSADSSGWNIKLPLESVNRDHFFRMVELCWPKYLQKLIRKMANTAIDKVIEGILKLIPYGVGSIAGSFWDSLKVFRKIIDLPLYPSCNCKDDDNTQDSAWLPLNWRFAQNEISKDVDTRHKKLFPKWEENQHPMYPSADISGYSNIEREINSGTNKYYDLRLSKYGPTFLLKGTGQFFNDLYPNYNGFTSVINEQQRISDWWHKIQLGYMITINRSQGKPFSSFEISWRNSLLKDIHSIKSEKAQTAALQFVGVGARGLSTQAESSSFTSFALFEVSTTALQNKKNLKHAVHKNVDLMGKHMAQAKISSKKTRLGF